MHVLNLLSSSTKRKRTKNASQRISTVRLGEDGFLKGQEKMIGEAGGFMQS